MSKKKKDAPAPAGAVISVASHPRAAAAVRSAKGWGGLIGFALGAGMTYRTGAPLEAAVTRGLLTGGALLLVTWTLAVAIWRELVVAEIRALAADVEAGDV